eukprot:scaffold36392_cov30-Tisochrysis_lutea.AAC.6
MCWLDDDNGRDPRVIELSRLVEAELQDSGCGMRSVMRARPGVQREPSQESKNSFLSFGNKPLQT